jgi:biopolymer transport protein ExbB
MILERWRRMAAFLTGVACAALILLMTAGTPVSAQPETGATAPAATAPDAAAPAGGEAVAPVTEPGAEVAPGTEPAAGVEGAAPEGAGIEPAAPTMVTEPGAATETVENPYGLGALLREGDWVSRTVFGILLIMSVGTWYILFTKYLEQGRVMKHARTADNRFWRASSVKEGIAQLEGGSAFRAIVEDGQKAVQEHASLSGAIDMNEWVSMALSRSVDIVNNRLQSGLAFLASVGSTAPFVGLFGTVWGIYHALIKIGVSGQASIDQVAGPVGEALIMTALGLAVAVPAVLIYNMLVRRNRVIMERVRGFASDVHGFLLSGARGSAKRG